MGEFSRVDVSAGIAGGAAIGAGSLGSAQQRATARIAAVMEATLFKLRVLASLFRKRT